MKVSPLLWGKEIEFEKNEAPRFNFGPTRSHPTNMVTIDNFGSWMTISSEYIDGSGWDYTIALDFEDDCDHELADNEQDYEKILEDMGIKAIVEYCLTKIQK